MYAVRWGVSAEQVYLAKHRVGLVFRVEWDQAKKEVHDPPPRK